MTAISAQTPISTVTPASSVAPAAAGTANPLGSLSGNFGNFLSLLMTQLKNQDPTNPMDANQFTSQLVQFTGVEQQINTNTSLGQLIQLTQASAVTQSSAILGRHVTVQSDHIPLQNGTGQMTFTAPSAGTVSIAIKNDSGQLVRQATVKAAAGANAWTWDGKTDRGQTAPDGSYAIAVTGGPAGVPAAAIPFTVSGVATSVTTKNNAVNLNVGAMAVPFSAVQSVGN